MKPDWSSVYTSEINGETIFEISLSNPDKIFASGNEKGELTDSEQSESDIRLLMVADGKSGNVENAYYISFMGSEAKQDLTELHYQKMLDFSGKLFYQDLKGNLINGWIYQAGKIRAQISPSTKEAYMYAKKHTPRLRKCQPVFQERVARNL